MCPLIKLKVYYMLTKLSGVISLGQHVKNPNLKAAVTVKAPGGRTCLPLSFISPLCSPCCKAQFSVPIPFTFPQQAYPAFWCQLLFYTNDYPTNFPSLPFYPSLDANTSSCLQDREVFPSAQ